MDQRLLAGDGFHGQHKNQFDALESADTAPQEPRGAEKAANLLLPCATYPISVFSNRATARGGNT
jgi:hypothetical protein